jgi:hypothetical protein
MFPRMPLAKRSLEPVMSIPIPAITYTGNFGQGRERLQSCFGLMAQVTLFGRMLLTLL